MKTSVLITVYNRSDYLRACLKALAVQLVRPDEVIVSDDGSDPRHTAATRAFCENSPLPVRYVRQEDKGYRLAAARNNAIRAAAGDYIISIDCDILFLPDTLQAHLDACKQGYFLAGNRALLPEAAGRDLLNQDFGAEQLDILWNKSDRTHLAPCRLGFIRNSVLRRLKLARRHKPKILGCHFSLFKQDIEKLNGFDEDYEGWGLEDDDFTLRLHQAGIRGRQVILTARAMHLWHPPADSQPAGISAGQNFHRFTRRQIPTFCENGLSKAPV